MELSNVAYMCQWIFFFILDKHFDNRKRPQKLKGERDVTIQPQPPF